MVAFSTALGTDRLFGLSNLPEPDRVATVEVAVDGRLRRSGDVFDLGSLSRPVWYHPAQ